jgi:hypothetical protein
LGESPVSSIDPTGEGELDPEVPDSDSSKEENKESPTNGEKKRKIPASYYCPENLKDIQEREKWDRIHRERQKCEQFNDCPAIKRKKTRNAGGVKASIKLPQGDSGIM